MIIWIALLSVAISVAAQLSLKAGMASASVRATLEGPFGPGTLLAVLSSPRILAGFVMYGLGAVIWLAVLARWDVSKAYPLVGVGFVLTALVGWMSGEQVGLMRLVGVGFICAGVFLVARS